MTKIIEYRIIEPEKKSDKLHVLKTLCSAESCPLLEKGKCIQRQMLGRCVYGSHTHEYGSTQRSKNYYKDKESFKEQQVKLNLPPVKPAYQKSMVVIGDYIYLPYPFMDMADIGWIDGPRGLVSSRPFIKLSDFNFECVKGAYHFIPRDWFSNEIVEYRKKSLPLFLYHLSKLFPDLYQKLCDYCPQVKDKTLKLQSVTSLSVPIYEIPADEIRFTIDELTPTFWNGKTLTLCGPFERMTLMSYFSKIRPDNLQDVCTLTINPSLTETKVTVTDPELIELLVEKNPTLLECK
jgi:hypothetical protein